MMTSSRNKIRKEGEEEEREKKEAIKNEIKSWP